MRKKFVFVRLFLLVHIFWRMAMKQMRFKNSFLFVKKDHIFLIYDELLKKIYKEILRLLVNNFLESVGSQQTLRSCINLQLLNNKSSAFHKYLRYEMEYVSVSFVCEFLNTSNFINMHSFLSIIICSLFFFRSHKAM